MAIDTYAPCPGGTGKKIKFCCNDLVGDLEQLDRLIEGDQITAALDQVSRLQEKHPGRACLMATRTKLELATKRFVEAATSSQSFLAAFPENPLALGQAAIADALAGRIQEAAALFDKARAAAAAMRHESSGGQDASPELVRIAATLIQAAAQMGQAGFAQGLLDWIEDRNLATEEEQRMLSSFVGSSGVPPALRTKIPFTSVTTESPWRFEFDAALGHAKDWQLAKSLATFRGLTRAAGTSRELFTNIAVLCEMLARPMEAAEAWLAVANLPGIPADDAAEATGRAIALETEANPERSPQVKFGSRIAPLALPMGEEGTTAIELLEDKLRHDPGCEPASFDRSAWVSRNAVPPRSAWRVYESAGGQSELPRVLGSLLLFGRQTDREPEAVIQGFAPDVAAVLPRVAELLGCSFSDDGEAAGMPGMSPTNWLLGAQFKTPLPASQPAPAAPGEPSLFDTLLEKQRAAVADRLVSVWPDTPLPELLGKSPRQALAEPEGRRRVEAMVTEGEATSRRREVRHAWTRLRNLLGIPAASPIADREPLVSLPPLRWHRLDMVALPIEQLRAVFVMALEAGFELAAERAAQALVSRFDAMPEDRWEAYGALLQSAESTGERLDVIGKLRAIAKEIKANDGMLDVAELRVRMQRGDELEATRLLDHLQREHARDQQVLQALAEVLMEAGVDLRGGPARGATAASTPTLDGGAARAASGSATAGKLWTPGGEPAAGQSGEKKIWTPG
jgi:tetratricopeptide (TPR) repeat protein